MCKIEAQYFGKFQQVVYLSEFLQQNLLLLLSRSICNGIFEWKTRQGRKTQLHFHVNKKFHILESTH